MRTLLIGFVVACFGFSCGDRPDLKSKWEQEIVKAESDFQAMASKKGIHAVFVAFADTNAVILRSDSLYMGRQAIDDFYNKNHSSEKVNLTWKPDFVEVSASGDLAYTYGKYVYRVRDSLGIIRSREGIFHTIWKRQPDGSWRFVWD
mgnify:CR=1 FL=1